MIEHQHEWIAYSVFALAALLEKFNRHMRKSRKEGLSTRRALGLWFYDDGSMENKASWVATMAGVWLIGVLVIHRVGVDSIPLLGLIVAAAPPIVHTAVAAFVGSLAEYTVPPFIKFAARFYSKKFNGAAQ